MSAVKALKSRFCEIRRPFASASQCSQFMSIVDTCIVKQYINHATKLEILVC